ncbi:hypothetical protein IRJ41_012963 [Triplophysa rosa]|uniref:C-type lectin domain-containing protein n=1 Tax=Triplophysa rosa TaxID=992332 RepID=A0A9W8C6Z3_TRIRA|nr:hypothetical protein IRJ41_012963 [Triplophysa rosa]
MSLFVLLLLSEYHYINKNMTWSEAQSYCRGTYTDLATVGSMKDMNRMMSIVGAGYNESVWIGLKRATQSRWGWSMGNDTVTKYSNWASGNASTGVGCAFNNSTKWSTTSCSTEFYFVCYNESNKFIIGMMLKNWTDAQSYCRNNYIDLATVESSTDQQELYDFGEVWIGLFSDSWQWSDQWSIFFRNWVAGHPSGSGDCVAMLTTDSGKWAHDSCDVKRHFICHGQSIGYIKIQSPSTWADAQSYCRQYHTDLATVKSVAEQNEVHAVVGDGGSYWIGLFLDSWQWSDKWSLFFRNWDAGQPSETSGSDDCVAMSTTASGKWTHDSCDLKRPFICHGSPKLRQYHYVNEGMTWVDALNYCRARFIEMATVDTMNDVSTMMNEVDHGYNGSVWIGLYRSTQISWVWSTENTALFHYSNWNPGEPNGNWECVKSFNGSWFDVDCALTFPFVCFNESTGYVHVNISMTWKDALSYCRQHHTDLASVTSPEQQRLINDESSVWIGLSLNSWLWSDGWGLFFRNWAAGHPSQTLGSGNCAAMSATDSGKWIHPHCDQKFPFVCYGGERFQSLFPPFYPETV